MGSGETAKVAAITDRDARERRSHLRARVAVGEYRGEEADRRPAQTSPPVIHHVDPRAVVACLVRPLHHQSLNIRSKTAIEHPRVRLVARRVHPSREACCTLLGCEALARRQQTIEVIACPSTRAHGAELDVARPAPRFRAPSRMTHCQPDKLAVTPQEQRVAELLVRHRSNLGRYVESFVYRGGHASAFHPLRSNCAFHSIARSKSADGWVAAFDRSNVAPTCRRISAPSGCVQNLHSAVRRPLRSRQI